MRILIKYRRTEHVSVFCTLSCGRVLGGNNTATITRCEIDTLTPSAVLVYFLAAFVSRFTCPPFPAFFHMVDVVYRTVLYYVERWGSVTGRLDSNAWYHNACRMRKRTASPAAAVLLLRSCSVAPPQHLASCELLALSSGRKNIQQYKRNKSYSIVVV